MQLNKAGGEGQICVIDKCLWLVPFDNPPARLNISEIMAEIQTVREEILQETPHNKVQEITQV